MGGGRGTGGSKCSSSKRKECRGRGKGWLVGGEKNRLGKRGVEVKGKREVEVKQTPSPLPNLISSQPTKPFLPFHFPNSLPLTDFHSHQPELSHSFPLPCFLFPSFPLSFPFLSSSFPLPIPSYPLPSSLLFFPFLSPSFRLFAIQFVDNSGTKSCLIKVNKMCTYIFSITSRESL